MKEQKLELFSFLAIIFAIFAFHSKIETRQTKQELTLTQSALQEAKTQRGPNLNPPLISLSEDTKTYRFVSGSHELPSSFQQALRYDIVPKVKKMLADYDCDRILVTGYTDTAALAATSRSNSDKDLIDFMYNCASKVVLTPGSNSDLALYRAVSVARFLRCEELLEVEIVPQGRAQLFLPGLRPADFTGQSDARMRRIEIEVTQSGRK